jgi:glycine dehydrogenase subunit 1
MLGRRSFEQVGRICLSRAEYLKAQIAALPDFEIPFSAPTFNELVVRRKNGQAAPLLASLAAQGILAGIDLGRFYPERKSDLLLAVTEKHEKSDLDRLVTALGNA